MNRFYPVLSLVLLSSFITGPVASAPTTSPRYPFDPVCGWGRIADGRGMIVRCLTQEEAQRLLTGFAPTTKNPPEVPSGTSPNPPSSSSTAPTPAPNPATSNSPSPSPSTVTAASPAVASKPGQNEDLQATLVGVTADTGELPLARKKLGIPLDKYVACVNNHGGLQGATGQAVIKFMVTERSRAEGAGVEKFEGITAQAARCIADVIDRRPTGTPEAPIVEGKATIVISRKVTR